MSLSGLFTGFGRVGLLGFGGGPSMLPLMQRECVDAGWVTDEQFLEGLAAGNALPGPISTKMAVYVGWIEAGPLGAAAALAGVVLPSALLMAVLGGLLVRHRDNEGVAAALRAVKPAIVGMLAFVAYDLAPAGVTNWVGASVAVGAFAALVWRVPPALVIVAAAAFGLAAMRS